MKKTISILLTFIIVVSAFITEIPVFAAASDSPKDNDITGPIIYTDENENVYTINIDVNEKEIKIWFISFKYISSFSIEAIETTNDGVESSYTYKSKEYKYWWFPPKTIEKAFRKEKLTNIYALLYDFQTVCKMYEEYNCEVELSDNAEALIEKLISDYTKCVKDKIESIPPDESDVAVELASATLDKIYKHFNIGDISKLEYINDFYEDLKEYSNLAKEMCEKTSKTTDYWYSFLRPYLQSDIDVNAEINSLKDYKVKELFKLINDETEKENSKFKKESKAYKKYTTRFAHVNQITAPEFEFIYPSNWKITKEDVVVNKVAYIEEWIELTDNNNLKITYMSLPRRLGGYGRKWIKAEAIEVAKSSFMPGYVQAVDYSSLGEFVVAKIHETGFMLLDVDTDFQEIDNYYYAVIPKSYLGKLEYADRLDGIGFNYGGNYHQHLFFAVSNNNKFTLEEEKEIIKILSSFK